MSKVIQESAAPAAKKAEGTGSKKAEGIGSMQIVSFRLAQEEYGIKITKVQE